MIAQDKLSTWANSKVVVIKVVGNVTDSPVAHKKDGVQSAETRAPNIALKANGTNTYTCATTV